MPTLHFVRLSVYHKSATILTSGVCYDVQRSFCKRYIHSGRHVAYEVSGMLVTRPCGAAIPCVSILVNWSVKMIDLSCTVRFVECLTDPGHVLGPSRLAAAADAAERRRLYD